MIAILAIMVAAYVVICLAAAKIGNDADEQWGIIEGGEMTTKQRGVTLSPEMVKAIEAELDYMYGFDLTQTEEIAMHGYAIAMLVSVILKVERKKAEQEDEVRLVPSKI